MKSHRLMTILLGLAVTGMIEWTQFTSDQRVAPAFHRIESLLYDLRLNLARPRLNSKHPVVIVDIDERSLAMEGHWPWRRDKIALLLDNLFDSGTAIVGFDIVFPEPGRNSGLEVIDRLAERSIDLPEISREIGARLDLFDNDAILAARLENNDIILGYIFRNTGEPGIGTLPPEVPFTSAVPIANIPFVEATDFTGNIEILQEAAGHGGFFSIDMTPDQDGIIRRVPLVMRYQSTPYLSLALETVRLFMLADSISVNSARVGDRHVVESIAVSDFTISTDMNGRILVPFYGPFGTFPYISATDVIRGTADTAMLDGAIVLIGTTAPGLLDLRATPMHANFPGVEIHANIIAGILDDNIPYTPSWARGADFLTVFTIGVALSVLLGLGSLAVMFAVYAIVLSAIVAVNYWLWSAQQINLGLAAPILMASSILFLNLVTRIIMGARRERQIKSLFGQYVPAERVEEMVRREHDEFAIEGEMREMSVLFSDIRSFTTISEGLPPTRLKEMLNEFLTPITETIFNHGGTIDKYVGDMVMAFWGAPLRDEAHAEHAVEAALAMQAVAIRLRSLFQEKGLPEIRIGVGINSGNMNVGDMGSKYRRSYTVLGDAVNLASRLEGASKLYGAQIVVGEQTWAMTRDAFIYQELDLVQVKGKSIPVRIFEPLCRADEATGELLDELRLHGEALDLYRTRAWDKAHAQFSELAAAHPGRGIYPVYIKRLGQVRNASLPDDWSGIFESTTK